MRLAALTLILWLAACSGETEPAEQKSEAAAAEQFSAGQWEMATEVTKVMQRDQGPPAIDMAQGSKSSRSVCLTEAEAKKPQPALFVPEGFDCTYRDSYVRGGRVNATLACTRPGLSGNIATNINGSFTAEGFAGTSTTETSLAGQGDVRLDTKLSGRRIGACSAAPSKG